MASPKLVLRGATVNGGLPPGARNILAPKLVLRGGAATGGPPFGPRITGTAALLLLGQPTALSISQTLTMGWPQIFLLAGKAVGKERLSVPTRPVDWILLPTNDIALTLPPTVEEDFLLIPTTEREM